MTQLTIEPLTRLVATENAERIAALLNRIPLLEYTAHDVLAEIDSHGKPLAGKWDQSLVARAEDKIVGALIAHLKEAVPPHYPGPSCYLSEIAVDPDWEHQGIARMMTEQWLSNTAQFAPHSLQTNSSNENGPVIEFYRRLGFNEVSRKTYDNRVDAIMFRTAPALKSNGSRHE